jgi:hypothetical protein
MSPSRRSTNRRWLSSRPHTDLRAQGQALRAIAATIPRGRRGRPEGSWGRFRSSARDAQLDVASPQTEVAGSHSENDDEQHDEPDRPKNVLGHCCTPNRAALAGYAFSRDPAIVVDGVLTLLVNGFTLLACCLKVEGTPEISCPGTQIFTRARTAEPSRRPRR